MREFKKIKRKNLDVEQYSKALNDSINYRVYAEAWYLDILTDEKWECWVYGDYEAIMPVPLQFKFGIKFVTMPIYCQQLGVFYKEEISDELFKAFEKKLHKYRVRSYCFNEENTERYNPKGEKRVNHVLDLNSPYDEIFQKYRKDKKKNINQVTKRDATFEITENIENYYSLLEDNYSNVSKPKKELFEKLISEKLLIQYIGRIDGEINNHRIFIISKFRIYIIASARKKSSREDLSSIIIDKIIKQYSNSNKLLDFEGSMLQGVANFNSGFGAEARFYTSFTNFSLKKLKIIS